MSDAPLRRIFMAKAMAVLLPAALTFEGMRYVAYYDPPGVLTVCAGSTTDVEKGKRYTHDECMARLDADMMKAVRTVERCAPDLPLGPLIAFSDTVYNVGPIIVCDTKNSTAARLLKAGDWRAACQQLPRWNKTTIGGQKVELPGLTKRRAHALEVCLA